MKAQTSGIVVALASTAVGGLLPAAIAAQSAGTYEMAAGLGVVALMNAVIAVVHIGMPGATDRTARKAGTGRMSPSNVESKPAHQGDALAAQATPKEPLNFPVLGWYSLPPEDVEDVPLEAAKKPAKSRA